jgi:hypothetical protein
MENKVTPEALQKAFELLNEASTLVKSKDAVEVTAAGADVIIKSEDAVDPEKIKKSQEIAGFLVKAGMSEKEAVDTLVKGGLSLTEAQGAYASVIASAQAGKEGGTVSTLGAAEEGIKKSEDVVEVADTIKKSLEPINEAINKGFEGFNTIVKSLQENNAILVTRLEKLEKVPNPKKSLTGVGAIDRFAKSEDAEQLPAGTEKYDITNKADLKKLVDRIDAENDEIIRKGNASDALLEKAISHIEVANEVPVEAYARLRAMGCILVKPQ